MRPISTRVKAMLLALGAAAAAGIVQSLTAFNWTELVGPTWSPVLALGVGSALAFAVKETAFGRFLRENGQPDAADLVDGGNR